MFMLIRLQKGRKERSQAHTEYAILLGVMVLTIILVLTAVGLGTNRNTEDMGGAFSVEQQGGEEEETEPQDSMHVQAIRTSLSSSFGKPRVIFRVIVEDQNGRFIRGGRVEATFYVKGQRASRELAVSNGQGIARFTYKSWGLSRGDRVSLEVDNVVMPGYRYASGNNIVSSAYAVIR